MSQKGLDSIYIAHQHLQAITNHLKDQLPYEGCGILVGHEHTIHATIPIKNIASQPLHAFVMNENDMANALMMAEKAGLDWLGIFHSHIGHAPIPSQTDIYEASQHTADMVHLIASFEDGRLQLGAWRINRYQRVYKVAILQPGEANPINSLAANTIMTINEKSALISASVIAVVLLIIIALTLLPPAPSLDMIR